MLITVREIAVADEAAWDNFVKNHPDGTFCHRAGWRTVVENGAKHRCIYFLAERDGAIVGVLPLVYRKSRLFGNALISSMFAVYGGPLAVDDGVYRALDEAAWDKAVSLGAATLEYRTAHARNHDLVSWLIDEKSATFRKVLKATEEDILLDIPRKQRAVVRKALKAGLTCVWDRDIDTFYSLYAESVRNLGTPVFPKRLFTEFLEVFGDDVDVQIVYTAKGEAVAGLMSFYHGDWVLPYYAGGTRQAREYGAHDFMYYELMLRAVARGTKGFDFGRSKVGSGPYRFKKNWGFEPTSLQYQIRVAPGAEQNDLSPTNKKFEFLVKTWKKLPLPVANFIGPLISRHLG